VPPVLTSRFAEAFAYAASLHARQVRKGTNVPYLSHLMSVAALVLEDGGDEDEAIAGLLHDAVEDQGGQPTLDEIRRRFGAKVARIVLGCTDSDTVPKPPWRERKEGYIAHIRHAEADVRRVSSADKLHNARSILTDYRVMGDALFARFTASKEETLWYYRSLIEAFRAAGSGRMVEELDLVVREIERLSGGVRS
jgi:(p)ppGpp synthase/HD superfamily hydrolase